MISRDEAYKETAEAINSRTDKELECLQTAILDYVSEGYFYLTCSNISESTIDAIKEKGYDVTKCSNPFGETYYEISWGPKEE